MEVKTGSSAVPLRCVHPSRHPHLSLSCFAAFHTGRHRNLCEEHCFVGRSGARVRHSGERWDIVEKIRQNERSEGEGDCRLHGEGEREKREGEGKALTSCGNTHFSHELIQTRKVTYSIPNTQGEKESAQCVHCLKGPLGSILLMLGTLQDRTRCCRQICKNNNNRKVWVDSPIEPNQQ